MINTIYLDMDGVIANFDKKYHSIFGVNCRDDINKSNWDTFIFDHKGFEVLELMPDAEQLLNFLFKTNKNICILSCAGKLKTYHDVVKQKTQWLSRNGLGLLPHLFTYTKADKSKYATSSSLLIDDSIQCIEPFIQAGGLGILHTNTANTIKLFEEQFTACAQS